MAKLKNPLLSLGAVGSLAKTLSFSRRRRTNIVQQFSTPTDPKTFAQRSWRHMYQKAVALWHALSPAEQQSWNSDASRRHMTGFAWFMSQALKPNPGLYLPLQGGIMAGDIDMAGHSITDLPDPTLAQDPVTKQYLEDNIPPVGGNITILLWNYNNITQGTWIFAIDPDYIFNGVFYNSTGADGDEINFRAVLAAGTYSLAIICKVGGGHGIAAIDVDADQVANLDMYNAGILFNVRLSAVGIVIATTGIKDIAIRVNGKNPAASGYSAGIASLALWRTA